MFFVEPDLFGPPLRQHCTMYGSFVFKEHLHTKKKKNSTLGMLYNTLY
jgi:hypothetical protein